MSRPSSRYPTELELEILKVLWRDGAMPVKEVRNALTRFRDLAHTSVLTIMNIMTEKGYLRKKKEGKTYVYEALVQEKETTRQMLGDIVDRVFAGSTAAAVVNLLETRDIDDDELAKLRSLINERTEEIR